MHRDIRGRVAGFALEMTIVVTALLAMTFVGTYACDGRAVVQAHTKGKK